MAKSSRTRKVRNSDFAALQGGVLDTRAVLRRFGATRRRLIGETTNALALRRQAGKYLSQIAAPLPRGKAMAAEAVEELRRVTERLAKRKLTAPQKVHLPPIAWGEYSLRFTPPYTGLGTYSVGQISSVTGNPVITASGVDNLGQMTCSVDTNTGAASAGTASNLLGIYFKPLFSNATARISFESEISFSWYVNSIRNKLATSSAQGLIQLFQYDSAFVQPSLRRGAFIGWNEVAENSLDFDFISESGPTWYLEAPVSSAHFYFVVISLTCTAAGAGWPGSLAGAKAVVTVPSITVHVSGTPVAHP